MAEERSTTPEKQLLKLIEDPKAQTLSSKGIKHKGLSLFSLAALRGRISFFKDKIALGFSFKNTTFDIKLINGILQICIFVLAIYLGVNLVVSIMNLNKIPELSQDVAASIELGSPQKISLLKNSVYYLEKARSRDIFKFGRFFEKAVEEVAEEVLPPEEIELMPSKLEQVEAKFSLVGIAWSEDPDAMIEDINTKKIYFLKRGETLDGMQIQAILRDRVVLSFEGEEIELR